MSGTSAKNIIDTIGDSAKKLINVLGWKSAIARNSKKSIKDRYDILLKEQFNLSDNYEDRIIKLEQELHNKTINSDNLNVLIHLYTVCLAYSNNII